MHVHLSFHLSALDHESWDSLADEIRRLFKVAAEQAIRQLDRPGALCTAPEADDVLRSPLGRIIGSLTVTR